MNISLSLWSLDTSSLADEVKRYAPWVESFHIDIMDGTITNETLFGPGAVRTARRSTDKPIEVHLMSSDITTWTKCIAEAGADALILHSEACSDVENALSQVKSSGMSAGIAFELHQEPSHFDFGILSLDIACVMGTPIGVKGREFEKSALEKVRTIVRSKSDSSHPHVTVDGGIREHSVEAICAAGAEGVVAGSIVTQAEDPLVVIDRLHTMGR